MAGVAHIPYLEKRPSGFFFRRRFPGRLAEIPHHIHGSSLCLSLRTDVLSEAKPLARALCALTDLGFALKRERERPVQHLNPQSMTLLKEFARFQIAAHEAQRACAEPRSEEAARFAAEVERNTQDMLQRALALGDRAPAVDPLREMARRFGVTLDEDTGEWRALAFEALRVMLDASRERERRELGVYSDVTPVFRSVLTGSAAPDIRRPLGTANTIPAPASVSVSDASENRGRNSSSSNRTGAVRGASGGCHRRDNKNRA